ncbi:hypothetical protein DFAR_4030008 [Desulfarculales bacterium]
MVYGYDMVDASLAAWRAVECLSENVPLYTDMRVKKYLDFVVG